MTTPTNWYEFQDWLGHYEAWISNHAGPSLASEWSEAGRITGDEVEMHDQLVLAEQACSDELDLFIDRFCALPPEEIGNEFFAEFEKDTLKFVRLHLTVLASWIRGHTNRVSPNAKSIFPFPEMPFEDQTLERAGER